MLVETNLGEGGGVTTFIVEPLSEGKHRSVTIATEGATRRSGGLGSIERFLTTMFLERIYKTELTQLARVCEGTYDEELEAISAYDEAKADPDEVITFEEAIAEIESQRDEL